MKEFNIIMSQRKTTPLTEKEVEKKGEKGVHIAVR